MSVTSTGPMGRPPLTLAALRDRLEAIERALDWLEQNREKPSLRLDQLTNCAPMGTVADGQAPIYSRAAGQYEPGQGGGGGGVWASALVKVSCGPPGFGGGPGPQGFNVAFGAPYAIAWLINDVTAGGGADSSTDFGTGFFTWITNLAGVSSHSVAVNAMPVIYTPNFVGRATLSFALQWTVCSTDNTQYAYYTANDVEVGPATNYICQVSDFSFFTGRGSVFSLGPNGIMTSTEGTYVGGLGVNCDYTGARFVAY